MHSLYIKETERWEIHIHGKLKWTQCDTERLKMICECHRSPHEVVLDCREDPYVGSYSHDI